jgi:hypothetical protein
MEHAAEFELTDERDPLEGTLRERVADAKRERKNVCQHPSL